MFVKSIIKINRNKINQLSKSAITALEKTGEALHTEVVQAQVVPRKDGALQNEKFSVDYTKSNQGAITLTFEGPYARRLYYHPEFNFRTGPWSDSKGNHEGNPNAKGLWLEDWQKGGSKEDFFQNTFETFYKQEADL